MAMNGRRIFDPPFVYKLEIHLNDAVSILRKRNGISGVTVKITDENKAKTDGENILIGKQFPLLSYREDEKGLVALLKGVLFHEMGHILYTPFSVLYAAEKHLMAGSFWPSKPSVPSTLLQYMKNGKREKARVYSAYEKLENIIEDGRIENLMLTYNGGYGALAAGLRLVRKVQYDGMKPFSEMIEQYEALEEEKKPEFAVECLFSLILSAAKFKSIKGQQTEALENHRFFKTLLGLIDRIDDAVDTVAAKDFYRNVNNIFCAIFDDYLLPYFETINDSDEEIEEETDSAGDKTGNTTSSAVEKALKAVTEAAGIPAGNKLSGKEVQKIEKLSDPAKKVLEGLPENEKNSFRGENGSLWTGYGPKTIYTEVDEALISGLDIDAISKIEIDDGGEGEICEKLNESANIDFGEIHKNLSLEIERPNMIGSSEEMIRLYSTFVKYIEAGKEVARVLKPHLNWEQKQTWEKNQYFGARFRASRVARPDLRYFDKRKNLARTPSLSVAILVDESGSMQGSKIKIAQATAICLYEMCCELDVPFCVFGHCEKGYRIDVNIRNYCFFGERNESTKYKLLSIRSGGCNRDGAALRYTADILSHQQTDRKLLLVISDGRPSAEGYGGDDAKKDIQGVIFEYERFGVSFIAAAIDADKENIRKIYGSERFLRIDEIETLPEQLLMIVKKSLF